MSRSLREKKSSAGRLGGVQTLRRHGRGHYVAMGKAGGRPRKDLGETLSQLNAAEKDNNERRIPGGIVELKRRWSEIEKRRVGLVASG